MNIDEPAFFLNLKLDKFTFKTSAAMVYIRSMKLIDRYLISNFIKPLIYCLVSFTILFIIGDLFEHLDKFLRSPHWVEAMLKYYLLFIPSIFVYITAVAILLSLLFSLGTMQRHNEISALRSGGISIYRIVTPLLVLCFFFSLLVFIINETIVPQTVKQSVLLKTKQSGSGAHFDEIIQDVTYYNPVTHRSFYFKTFNLDKNIGTEVTVYELKAGGEPLKRTSARQARFLDGRWWLFKGVIYTFSSHGPPRKTLLSKEHFDYEVKPSDLKEESNGINTLSYRELRRTIERKKGYPPQILRRDMVSLYQKISLPLASLIMGLIGIAFGLKIGRGGVMAGVGVSMVLGFLYYVLYSVSIALGNQGLIPAWLAAWSGNIVFGAGGIYMIKRLN